MKNARPVGRDMGFVFFWVKLIKLDKLLFSLTMQTRSLFCFLGGVFVAGRVLGGKVSITRLE